MSNQIEQSVPKSDNRADAELHPNLLNASLGKPGDSQPGWFEKATVFGKSAALAFPAGVMHELTGVDHVTLPLSKTGLSKDVTVPVPVILENAAVGAGIGFAARVLLPEKGALSNVGANVVRRIFQAPAVAEGFRVGRQVYYAKSGEEVQRAGQELGTALGALAGGMPVGIYSYQVGAGLGGEFMASQTAAPFARAKADFYNNLNEQFSKGVDAAAESLKNAFSGKEQYTGSHKVAERYERISPSLAEQLKGTDYRLPDIKLEPGSGKGVNVLVVSGNGAEAAEFTSVTNALKEAGANVKVATPDSMWKAQPKGEFSLAQGMENSRVAKADMKISEGMELVRKGDIDAVFVPGGVENTSALRTDPGTLELLAKAHSIYRDVWTIGHGAQVLASTDAFPKGTMITGSGDIRAQDLPNAGFMVPKGQVIFDTDASLLSAQDAYSLNPFISSIGKRLEFIQKAHDWKGWILFSML
jgi:protease I